MERTSPKASADKADPRDLPEFRAWLKQSSTITIRSQYDVCSHLRRLSHLVALDRLRSEDNVNRIFASREVAVEMTVTVRSHLKRAAKMYLQFISQRRK